MSTCDRCGGSEWVCEAHEDKSWPDQCDCSAGVPCPDCNPLVRDGLEHYRIELDEAWGALASIGVALSKLDG